MGQDQSKQATINESIQVSKVKGQPQVTQIKLYIDCTCKNPNNIKVCGRCNLTLCGKCNSYKYLWLPIDMCNTCVIMSFTEEMSREDLHTLSFKQLKTYLRNYDLPCNGSQSKHTLIKKIITNRPLKNEQRKNYMDKRLKEKMLQSNGFKSGTSKMTRLKKLDKTQQERFQLYMMKKENLIDKAEYDLAIKTIPLAIENTENSPVSISSPSSSSSSSKHKKKEDNNHNNAKKNNNSNAKKNNNSNAKNNNNSNAKNNNNNNANNNNNNNNNAKNKTKRSKRKKKSNKNNNDNTSVKKNKPTSPINQDDNTCKICFDAAQSCVLMECGHLVTCYECGQKLIQCPICRSDITRVVKIYKI